MRRLVFLIIVLACSSTAVACGWEMVFGSKELGVSKGCCDNEGKLFLHLGGMDVCITKTRADLVLRLFRADVLVLCGVVLLSGASLYAMTGSVFSPGRSGEKVPDV